MIQYDTKNTFMNKIAEEEKLIERTARNIGEDTFVLISYINGKYKKTGEYYTNTEQAIKDLDKMVKIHFYE